MPPKPRKKKVLVADDDQVTLQALAAQLQGSGFQVFMAMDAMQTGMMIQRHTPDALVLDIQMPGGTGLEALKRIRASTKTHLMPVIAISGTATKEQQELARQLGVAEFLPKPLDFKRLREVLESLLETT